MDKVGNIQLDGFTKYHKPEGKIVILGFGSVGQTVLPMVLRHFDIDPSRVLVIDKKYHSLFDKYRGLIKYLKIEITRENMDQVLSKMLEPGDFLVNVSLNIDGIEIVEWCLNHGVMYTDTSIERWPEEPDETIKEYAERTLYSTHQEIRKRCGNSKGKATAVVTNGANPGLVTYFTKQALCNLRRRANLGGIKRDPQTKEEWAELAKALDVKVIQIAERDTQILKQPKDPNVFTNTWSCEGFWAEGRAPSELGWGTHENPKGPEGGSLQTEGPGNAAFLHQPGVSVLVKSWVPEGGCFNGFLIQHSEAVTLSDYLTTADKSYRPTVYYAYQPTDAAMASVHEMRGSELRFHRKTRIMKNSIAAGRDELGVLLLGHELNAYWFGSQLTIDQARELIPGESATSLQVGASLLGGMVWAYKNPEMGYCEPEDLPHDEVLAVARQYLGPVVGVRSDWTPLRHRNTLYKMDYEESDVWAFPNFRIQ